MAWTKIPAAHHPLYLAALPGDPRVRTIRMFGGLCSMVNGHMAAGLFGRSAFVRLPPDAARDALALDGAEPFDPMGRGHAMRDLVMLPEDVFDDVAELRAWLAKGIAQTATMPVKAKKALKAKPLTKPTVPTMPTKKAKIVHVHVSRARSAAKRG